MSNELTDSLGMVQHEIVRSLLTKTLKPEYGYSLEIFRNNVQVGAIRTSTQFGQTAEAKRGDSIYRVNLGTFKVYVEGQLTTRDQYTREYSVVVEVQIKDIARFLETYRQERDPIQFVHAHVQKAIREYADRTTYDQMVPTNIQAKAHYALSMEPEQQVAGLFITDVDEATLNEDESYEAIDLRPIVTLNGELKTREGYTRSYTMQLELHITDSYAYRILEASETGPLERIQISINSALEDYAYQHFYEDLSGAQFHALAERLAQHTHDLPDQVWECTEITNALHTATGEDSKYTPLDLNPLLTMHSTLTTREGYSRDCTVQLELQVIDRLHYRQLLQENNDPLNLVATAIGGELTRNSRQQFYEDLNEPALRQLIERSFQQFSSHMAAGTQLISIHSLILGDDAHYKPFNFSPLVTCNGQITTLEGYVRSYELVVEFRINNRRLYQGLEYEGAAPMERARVAIDSELQKYARQHHYEDLTEAQFIAVAEHAFDNLASRVTSDLSIVKAYNLTLRKDPTYINSGPRTLTVTGTLTTTDFRERPYEITVLLEVAHRNEFVTLTRQGNDPLKLVEVAIQGAIQRAADSKTHDEMSKINLGLAAHQAFAETPDATIGGLKLQNAEKFSLQFDASIQEVATIQHQTQIDQARSEQQATLTASEENNKVARLKIQQEGERLKYLFEINKKNEQTNSEFQQDIRQKMAAAFLERFSEDANQVEHINDLQDDLQIFYNILQLSSSPANNSNINQAQNALGTQQTAQIQGHGQGHLELLQTSASNGNSTQKVIRKEIPEWGILLLEVPLPESLEGISDNQERALQIWEVIGDDDLPFEETDILLKINKQRVATLADIETALMHLSATQETRVTVLRDGLKKILTIPPTKMMQVAQDEE